MQAQVEEAVNEGKRLRTGFNLSVQGSIWPPLGPQAPCVEGTRKLWNSTQP